VKGRSVEIPIPTYYGDEICYVNGVKYARDVVHDVLEYQLAVRGFGICEWVPKPDEYAFKEGDGSSHAAILAMLSSLPTSRILDLGCSGGLLAEKMRQGGHYVVGVDSLEVPGVRERTDEFYTGNLDSGIPAAAGVGFDVVIAGDVIEHLAKPLDALRAIDTVLRPGGQLLLSVPNFAHWYPRLRVLFGVFGYDRRGILDDHPPALLHPLDAATPGAYGGVRRAAGVGDRTPAGHRPVARPAPAHAVRVPARAPPDAARRGDDPFRPSEPPIQRGCRQAWLLCMTPLT
jgi:SAM-dependent methyltransferase